MTDENFDRECESILNSCDNTSDPDWPSTGTATPPNLDEIPNLDVPPIPQATEEPEPAPVAEPTPVAPAEPEPPVSPEAAPEPQPEPAQEAQPEPAPEPAPILEPTPEPVLEPLPAAEPQNTVGVSPEELSQMLDAGNASVLQEVQSIHTTLNDLLARVSKLRKLADMHEEVETNLNNQLNDYKNNFYRRIVNPILVEFFDIQEEIQQDLLTADEKTAEMLGDYVDMMSRTFKHYGVQIEQVNVGDAYDPRIHQPVKAVETDRPELDKTIAKTRKALVHSIDGKVEERARVHVYQYKAPKPAES